MEEQLSLKACLLSNSWSSQILLCNKALGQGKYCFVYAWCAKIVSTLKYFPVKNGSHIDQSAHDVQASLPFSNEIAFLEIKSGHADRGLKIAANQAIGLQQCGIG